MEGTVEPIDKQGDLLTSVAGNWQVRAQKMCPSHDEIDSTTGHLSPSRNLPIQMLEDQEEIIPNPETSLEPDIDILDENEGTHSPSNSNRGEFNDEAMLSSPSNIGWLTQPPDDSNGAHSLLSFNSLHSLKSIQSLKQESDQVGQQKEHDDPHQPQYGNRGEDTANNENNENADQSPDLLTKIKNWGSHIFKSKQSQQPSHNHSNIHNINHQHNLYPSDKHQQTNHHEDDQNNDSPQNLHNSHSHDDASNPQKPSHVKNLQPTLLETSLQTHTLNQLPPSTDSNGDFSYSGPNTNNAHTSSVSRDDSRVNDLNDAANSDEREAFNVGSTEFKDETSGTITTGMSYELVGETVDSQVDTQEKNSESGGSKMDHTFTGSEIDNGNGSSTKAPHREVCNSNFGGKSSESFKDIVGIDETAESRMAINEEEDRVGTIHQQEAKMEVAAHSSQIENQTAISNGDHFQNLVSNEGALDATDDTGQHNHSVNGGTSLVGDMEVESKQKNPAAMDIEGADCADIMSGALGADAVKSQITYTEAPYSVSSKKNEPIEMRKSCGADTSTKPSEPEPHLREQFQEQEGLQKEKKLETHQHPEKGREQPEKQQVSEKEFILHKLRMKKQAILRAMSHLSDNSYMINYDSVHPYFCSKNKDCSNGGSIKGRKELSKMGAGTSYESGIDGDEREHEIDNDSGLPFLGPGLASQYNELKKLLKIGLIGQEDKRVEESQCKQKDSEMNSASKEKEIQRIGKTTTDKDSIDLTTSRLKPKVKTNVSAFLMGQRGHGKTLVLERCLSDLARSTMKEQLSNAPPNFTPQTPFRVVRLNGLLYQGDNTVVCAREIIRQIGEMGREERRKKHKRKRKRHSDTEVHRTNSNQKKVLRPALKNETSQSESEQLPSTPRTPMSKPATRALVDTPSQYSPATPNQGTDIEGADSQSREATPLVSPQIQSRRSAFTTNMALLDEALRTACIDGIPILIVLDEFDAFLPPSKGVLSDNSSRSGGVGSTSDVGRNTLGGGTTQNDHLITRQLLFYHLLDRVADKRYLVSLVGTTTKLTIMSQFEKRVRSRADGTSKVFSFGHAQSMKYEENYSLIVKTLLGKFYCPAEKELESEYSECFTKKYGYGEADAMLELRMEVESVLRGDSNSQCEITVNSIKDAGVYKSKEAKKCQNLATIDMELEEDPRKEAEIDEFQVVRNVIERNYDLRSNDMRWFCRVLDDALARFNNELDEWKYQYLLKADKVSFNTCDAQSRENAGAAILDDVQIAKLNPKHMALSLLSMGACIGSLAGDHGSTDYSSNQYRQDSTQGQKHIDHERAKVWGRLVGTPNQYTAHYSNLLGTDPRLRSLLNLTAAQVAILLAARRIIARNHSGLTVSGAGGRAGAGTNSGTSTTTKASVKARSNSLPLTYQSIEDEYMTSLLSSGGCTVGSDRFPPHILYQSFIDLMEIDLVRVRKEFSGLGPRQYEHADVLDAGSMGGIAKTNTSTASGVTSRGNIKNIPLYVNLDWENEFMVVLKAGLLDCSTRLRDWGMKTNEK